MALKIKKEYILEAIDKLRSRKSRPDNMRIAAYVSKKYEVPKLEIREFLNQMTVEGSVVRVEYKGSISYRNPATFQRHRGITSTETVDPRVREDISCVIAEMICKNPSYLESGVSAKDLYTNLDFKTRKQITKTVFRDILEEEVRNGNFVRFENGYYCLGETNASEIDYEVRTKPNILKPRIQSRHTSPSTSSRNSRNDDSGDESKIKNIQQVKPPVKTYLKSSVKIKQNEDEDNEIKQNLSQNSKQSKESSQRETQATRESSRKRIQKIVFDPSDLASSYTQKKEKPTSPQGKKIIPKISIKKLDEREIKTELKIKDDSSDALRSERRGIRCFLCKFSKWKSQQIVCYECDVPVHEECVLRADLFYDIKNVRWFCSTCVDCAGCHIKKPAMLVACGLCDDYYHTKCIKLKKLKDQANNDEWFCNKCSTVFEEGQPRKKIKTEPDTSESNSNDSSYDEVKNTKLIKRERDEENIPDCSEWTCEEVYNYFLDYVLPEEANIFKDQEINGRVLLLLTRSDVVNNFKLKLGPALKIYRQVKKLQTRRSDIRLCWN